MSSNHQPPTPAFHVGDTLSNFYHRSSVRQSDVIAHLSHTGALDVGTPNASVRRTDGAVHGHSVASILARQRDEFEAMARMLSGTMMFPYRTTWAMEREVEPTGDRGIVAANLEFVSMQSITAMPYYENRSFEELRLEDLRAGWACRPPISVGEVSGSAATDESVDVGMRGRPAVSVDGHSCVICLDRRKSVVFFPCKHMCSCRECSRAEGLNSCPICRSEIALKTSVYW